MKQISEKSPGIPLKLKTAILLLALLVLIGGSLGIVRLFKIYTGLQKAELRVVHSLPQFEWQTLQKRILPEFEKACSCKVSGFRIEPINAVSRIEHMRMQQSYRFDLILLSNNQFRGLIDEDIMRDLTHADPELMAPMFSSLQSVGTYKNKLYFIPLRTEVDLTIPLNDLQSVKNKLNLQNKMQPVSKQIFELVTLLGGNPYNFYDTGNLKAYSLLAELAQLKIDRSPGLFKEEYFLQKATKTSSSHNSKVNSKTTNNYQYLLETSMVGIYKNSKQQEIGLAFIKFLTSKGSQLKMMNDFGWLSVRKDCYETKQNPSMLAHKNAIESGIYFRNLTYWKAFEKLSTKTMNNILLDHRNIVTILRDSQKKMQSIVYNSQNRTITLNYLSPNSP